MRVVDLSTGISDQKPFDGRRNCLAILLFTDAEKELVEGAANAAQSMARSALQLAGMEVSSARYATALTSVPGKESFVDIGIRVATEEPERDA